MLPKPTHFGNAPEIKFYEDFFATVAIWIKSDARHMPCALEEACSSGLGAMDAFHVVSAAASECEEIVTSEKPSKSIHRTKLVPVLSIDTEVKQAGGAD